jgi:hypothetical protein
MKLFWTLQLGIATAAAAALTAHCGGNVVGPGTDTGTGGGGDTGTETDTISETDTPSMPTGTLDDCTCACVTLMSAGGCGDVCSTMLNGATTPNFCEGMAPLAQCAACLAQNCGDISTAAGTCSGF